MKKIIISNAFMALLLVLFCTNLKAQTIFEAENGTTNGPVIKDASNASNGKVISGFEGAGYQDKITNVDGGVGGIGTIKVRYSNGNNTSGGLTYFKYIAGTATSVGIVIFPPTGDWNSFAEITIPFNVTFGAGILPDNNFKLRNEGDVAGVDIDNFTVTVGDMYIAETGLTVSPSALKVGVQVSSTLTASVSPDTASNKIVAWSSSDNAVATVSNTGVVTGVSLGSATITATSQDGSKTASCDVTVANPIIANGGFENGKAGWQKSWGNWTIVSDRHSGDSAAMVPLAGWGNGLVQRFDVDPQSVYEFKFWAKVSSKGADLPVYLSIKNSKGQNIGPDPNYTVKVSAKDWTQYAIKFQTIELMDSVDLWIGDGKTDTMYFDDFEVNKSAFISNGGFEDGKIGWERSFGSFSIVNDIHSGNAAALVALSNWSNGLVQRYGVEELSPYELKFWAKVASSSNKVDIRLGLKNSAGKNVGPDPNFNVPVDSKTWKQYSYKFNTLATVDSIDLWVGDGTTDSLYIDDIELSPSTIITNGSFESGKTGWGKSWGTLNIINDTQSGDSVAMVALNNWANGIGQRFNVEPVTSYEIKFAAKVTGKTAVDVNLSMKNSVGKNVGPDPNEKISVSSNSWKTFSLKFSTLALVDSIDLWIGAGGTDSFYLDNVVVTPLAFTNATGIALDSSTLTLRVNNTYKLKATIKPSLATNKAVNWISADTLIAKVDVNGTVTAKSIGTTTITATSVDGSFSATCNVTVESPVNVTSKSNSELKVYPNPVIDRITIENANAIERIEICSMTGKIVVNSIQSGNNANLDLSNLSSGLYILKIYQQNHIVSSHKLIKK